MINGTVVIATEVNRLRRKKSYLPVKSYNKERAERQCIVKQSLDESDHRTYTSSLGDSSGDDDGHLTRALMVSASHVDAAAPKRSASLPQIKLCKASGRSATRTSTTRKKKSVSANALTMHFPPPESRTASTVQSPPQPHSIRRRGSRGDLYNVDVQLPNSEQSSQPQRRSSSCGTPCMRRRKSSLGGKLNDGYLVSTSQTSIAPIQAPDPTPQLQMQPQNASIDLYKFSRKSRRRSCRGDIGMENIQCSIDVSNKSRSGNPRAGGIPPQEYVEDEREKDGFSTCPPMQIVETCRNCGSIFVIDHNERENIQSRLRST
jgi:hypothetical protein